MRTIVAEGARVERRRSAVAEIRKHLAGPLADKLTRRRSRRADKRPTGRVLTG